MTLIENYNSETGSEDFTAHVPVTQQESFVKGMYSSVDEATACELDRLHSEERIIPPCRSGCSHCCRYHILMNIAEAHILSQYIKREFSAGRINSLRLRTKQWHAWDNSRPGRYPSAGISIETDLSGYIHACPLLENGSCSAYSVRPLVCRTHLVRSHPRLCGSVNDPESEEDAPVVLKSFVAAAAPFSAAIKEYIENSGLDFTRSKMLLPHWLANTMGWDFDIPH